MFFLLTMAFRFLGFTKVCRYFGISQRYFLEAIAGQICFTTMATAMSTRLVKERAIPKVAIVTKV